VQSHPRIAIAAPAPMDSSGFPFARIVVVVVVVVGIETFSPIQCLKLVRSSSSMYVCMYVFLRTQATNGSFTNTITERAI